MGNKNAKGSNVKGGKGETKPAAAGQKQPKPSVVPAKLPSQLTEADFKFLSEQTGLSKEDIKALFDKFMTNNNDAQLDKKEFVQLYTQLRPENEQNLDEISEFVFRAFDSDRNGYLTFNEFMIAYALTSRGDLRNKLEYAFNLYDADANGYLDNNEIRDVITGMLDLLGADKKHNNPQQLAAECIKELDKSNDGKVSKDEFIDGLMKNFSLRALMNPFS